MPETPERFLATAGDFVDPDNDHVVVSRLGFLVDRSSGLDNGVFGMAGGRRIRDPFLAEEVFDSEKGTHGNAGISLLDVLSDPEAW